jgi:hypothetical protein
LHDRRLALHPFLALGIAALAALRSDPPDFANVRVAGIEIAQIEAIDMPVGHVH